MNEKKNNTKIIDGIEVQEIILEQRQKEPWEKPWDEQNNIVKHIWTASLETDDVIKMMEIAAERLGYTSTVQMTTGFHADFAEAAFCNRPKDWKKGDENVDEMDNSNETPEKK